MNRYTQQVLRATVGMLVVCVGPASAVASYEVDWYTIDAGSATTSTGGGYTLTGTIGQPDADVAPMTGGEFELAGGFWPGGGMPWYTLTLLCKDCQYGRIFLDPEPRNLEYPMYPYGTDVTLLAEPNEGKKFTKWKIWEAYDPNITGIDKNNPITIDMVGDRTLANRTVKAFFKCGGGGGIEETLPLLIVFTTLGLFALIRRRP